MCFDAPVGHLDGSFSERRYIASLGVEEECVDGQFYHTTSILLDTLEVAFSVIICNLNFLKVFSEINSNWFDDDFFGKEVFVKSIEGEVMKASLESSDELKNKIIASNKLGDFPRYSEIKQFLRHVYREYPLLDWNMFNSYAIRLVDLPNSPFDWSKWNSTGFGNNWFRREIKPNSLARLKLFKIDDAFSSEFSASICNE